MPRKFLFNHFGQSLVQILISIGLMGILMTVFVSMTANQAREYQALSEKLGSADLEKLLIASLADGTVCRYVLNNPTVLTFDSTQVQAGKEQTITMPDPDANGNRAALYTSIAAGAPLKPGPVAAQAGSPVSTYSNSLKAHSIQLKITSGSNGRYYGHWVVNFDPASLVRSLKPVSISNLLIVDDVTSPTNATITACQGVGGGSGRFQQTSIHFPGEPAGGGFITIPPATNPTVGGTYSPELLSNAFTFIPQGSRLDITVLIGDSLYYTNLGQNLAITYHLHIQPSGGANMPLFIGNGWNYPGSAVSIVSGNNRNFRTVVNTSPGVSQTVRIGVKVGCDPASTCSNASSAAIMFWSPAQLLIQEYY